LLHNAHIGEGIAPAMTDLLKGIEIKCHKNHLFAKKSEEIFESIRFDYYPHRPSRLRCHFLSLSLEIAKERNKEWNWEKDCMIVRCYLILSSGIFHYANIKEYESSASCYNSDKCVEKHAHKYWEEFAEGNFLNTGIEVLADSALYFPDWKTFPRINYNP
jgi:hypothetical protein